MHRKLAGFTSAALAVAGISSASFAQNTRPDGVPAPLPFAAQLGAFNVTPSRSQKGMFDVTASMAPILPLLQAIAGQSNLKIIISDEVQGLHTINVRLTQMSGEKAIQFIASASGLAWGKVGRDTYLVVRQNQTYQPVFRPEAEQQLSPQAKSNPGWKPFEFNGQQYYVVPLGKAGTQKPR